MKQQLKSFFVTGKFLTVLRLAFVLMILLSVLLFPSFAFAGPIPGGATG